MISVIGALVSTLWTLNIIRPSDSSKDIPELQNSKLGKKVGEILDNATSWVNSNFKKGGAKATGKDGKELLFFGEGNGFSFNKMLNVASEVLKQVNSTLNAKNKTLELDPSSTAAPISKSRLESSENSDESVRVYHLEHFKNPSKSIRVLNAEVREPSPDEKGSNHGFELELDHDQISKQADALELEASRLEQFDVQPKAFFDSKSSGASNNGLTQTTFDTMVHKWRALRVAMHDRRSERASSTGATSASSVANGSKGSNDATRHGSPPELDAKASGSRAPCH